MQACRKPVIVVVVRSFDSTTGIYPNHHSHELATANSEPIRAATHKYQRLMASNATTLHCRKNVAVCLAHRRWLAVYLGQTESVLIYGYELSYSKESIRSRSHHAYISQCWDNWRQVKINPCQVWDARVYMRIVARPSDGRKKLLGGRKQSGLVRTCARRQRHYS